MDSELVENKYIVKAPSFEGPLDLLLSLIESRKLFINEISLAEVANDFINYIKSINDEGEKRINNVSYFVLVAATLVLIKSKSLLPNINLTEEEEEKIDDLEKRLKLYQIIKEASVDIKESFGLNIIFTPVERIWDDPVFSPGENVNLSSIISSVNDVLKNLPEIPVKTPEIEIKKVINIEEVINSLTDRIQSAINLSFREFSKSHNIGNREEAKVNTIVSFLAMLELVREGIIDVIQNNTFEDINITKSEPINI